MKFVQNVLAVVATSIAICSGGAYAGSPNTTAANAVSYEVGQGWVSHYFEPGVTDRWFKFTTVGGRSYCMEAAQGSDSGVALDPTLSYYSDAAGLSLVQSNNNDGAFEPPMTTGARVCFSDTSTFGVRTTRTMKLNVPVALASDAGYMRVRVYQTTAFGIVSWDTNTYNEGTNFYRHVWLDVHNHGATSVTVTYRVCRNPSGLTCGSLSTSSLVVPPYSASNVPVVPGGAPGSGSASVAVAVPAPAGQVVVYSLHCGMYAFCGSAARVRLN